MESWIFLGLIMLVALLAKNQSLIIATGFILLVKLIPTSKVFLTWLQGKGINLGVTIITAAILVPIATGEIGLKDLLDAFKSPIGWWSSSRTFFQRSRFDCFRPADYCCIGFWNNSRSLFLKRDRGWSSHCFWYYLLSLAIIFFK